MLVELGDGPRVVGLELVVGNLVDPGADRLAEQLPTGLAADRIGDRADGIGGIDEAEGHRSAKIGPASDVRRRQVRCARPMLRAWASR